MNENGLSIFIVRNTCWRNALSDFLQKELQLNPHPKKTILQPTRYGIDFLGYIVKKDSVLVRRRVLKSIKQKLYFFNHLLDPDKYPFKQMNGNGSIEKMCRNREFKLPVLPEKKLLSSMQSSINSYYGIFRFADSYHLRKDLYINRFGNLQKMFYANKWFETIGLLAKYKKQ